MFLIAAKAFFSGMFAYAGAALTFLTTKPGVYLLIAGVAAGAYWYSGHEGYKRGVAANEAAHVLAQANAVAAAEKGARLRQAAQDKISHDADVAYAKAHQKTVTITKVITREIPTYVTQETDVHYPLPLGLIRVWDGATLGVDPSSLSLPAGKSDADAAPTTTSALAEAGVAAIRGYAEISEQLKALQAWVIAQRKASK